MAADLSSISFTSEAEETGSMTRRLRQCQPSALFEQLNLGVEEVRQMNQTGLSMCRRMGEVARDRDRQLDSMKATYEQSHRKCLEHIEILLYQQDYAQALAKIDHYKRVGLADMCFAGEQEGTVPITMAEPGCLSFMEARRIIDNSWVDLETKHRIWMQFALSTSSEHSRSLKHVTFKQVQQAQLDEFRREFDINSQNSEPVAKEMRMGEFTPDKKISRSINNLKSEARRAKLNSEVRLKAKDLDKSNEKLAGKNKSTEKRTTRKRPAKDASENRTSKKNPAAFVV